MADHNTLNVFEEKGSRPIEELLQEHWKIVDQGLGVARGTGPLEGLEHCYVSGYHIIVVSVARGTGPFEGLERLFGVTLPVFFLL